MSEASKDIMKYYGSGEMSDEEFLEHYGMPRRSGRYPWGSGDEPYQHTVDWYSRVKELRKQNFTYKDPETGETLRGDNAIAKSMGMTIKDFRTEVGIAKSDERSYYVNRAKSLAKDGLGASEIGKIMGKNESTIRSYLNEEAENNMNAARNTAKYLKKQIDEKGMIDIGKGANSMIGVSQQKFDQALKILENEGYPIYGGRIRQVTNPDQQTTQTVICRPGTPHSEIYNFEKVHMLDEDKLISRDNGQTFEKKFTYPSSMNSKRLAIRYAEDGGVERDGLIELRPGCKDLSLGESAYSQVRILVDGTHYLKGMAVYNPDLPDGIDVRFNTNKHKGTPALGDDDNTVLKHIKSDPDNPFGSAIKDSNQGGQYWYTDTDGTKKLGLINKRSDEGDWSDWKNGIPSQFLAKQSQALTKKQLDLAYADKVAEYDDICNLNNPTIKKYLLNKFADGCDKAAEDLKGAALPGQKYRVILPVPSLKDNEVYCPMYENGTKLALIRYPHAGTFEIPICTVNNKNKEARNMIGTQSEDAVGINHHVAGILSGADFDGDTVMCIPTHDKGGKVKIESTHPLKGLEGFDPTDSYGPSTYKGREKEVKILSKENTQIEMGKISNLITDMTLAGANENELAAAVRHSMVVIDANKHQLDYKRSEIDNNIAALHKKYQGKATGGASTILSKAKGVAYVDKRQGSPHINTPGKPWYDPSKPDGSLIYKTSDDDLYRASKKFNKTTGLMEIKLEGGGKVTYDPHGDDSDRYTPIKKIDKATGEYTFTSKDGTYRYAKIKNTQKSTKMAETDDAYTLVSKERHPMELLYADYANHCKALANTARKELMTTGRLKYNKEAADIYKAEVSSIMSKLNDSEKNAIKERAAQRMANVEIKSKQSQGLLTEKKDVKKASQQAITKYRQEVGSVSRNDRNIKITDREWEAIQAGAISENKLNKILQNTDIDNLREKATPKVKTTLSKAKINQAKAMSMSNYTLSEIAEKLGVSPSTISNVLKGKE